MDKETQQFLAIYHVLVAAIITLVFSILMIKQHIEYKKSKKKILESNLEIEKLKKQYENN